ncbi:hypothetical protein [Treponema sp.]|uniref:hypothetical protein n=1 Tax=Treponema sp. TaxID=166 RepID=UPI00388E83F4
MGIKVTIEVSKEDVETLAQTMECTEDEELKDFIERVLRNTNVSCNDSIDIAKEICKVNPFSMS